MNIGCEARVDFSTASLRIFSLRLFQEFSKSHFTATFSPICAPLEVLDYQFAIPFLSEKSYHFQISSIAFLEYPCCLNKTTKAKIASILKFVT
jgi:hypothetical protein